MDWGQELGATLCLCLAGAAGLWLYSGGDTQEAMKRQRSSTLEETTSSHLESASPAAEAPLELTMVEAVVPDGATPWGLFDLLPPEVCVSWRRICICVWSCRCPGPRPLADPLLQPAAPALTTWCPRLQMMLEILRKDGRLLSIMGTLSSTIANSEVLKGEIARQCSQCPRLSDLTLHTDKGETTLAVLHFLKAQALACAQSTSLSFGAFHSAALLVRKDDRLPDAAGIIRHKLYSFGTSPPVLYTCALPVAAWGIQQGNASRALQAAPCAVPCLLQHGTCNRGTLAGICRLLLPPADK